MGLVRGPRDRLEPHGISRELTPGPNENVNQYLQSAIPEAPSRCNHTRADCSHLQGWGAAVNHRREPGADLRVASPETAGSEDRKHLAKVVFPFFIRNFQLHKKKKGPILLTIKANLYFLTPCQENIHFFFLPSH